MSCFRRNRTLLRLIKFLRKIFGSIFGSKEHFFPETLKKCTSSHAKTVGPSVNQTGVRLTTNQKKTPPVGPVPSLLGTRGHVRAHGDADGKAAAPEGSAASTRAAWDILVHDLHQNLGFADGCGELWKLRSRQLSAHPLLRNMCSPCWTENAHAMQGCWLP